VIFCLEVKKYNILIGHPCYDYRLLFVTCYYHSCCTYPVASGINYVSILQLPWLPHYSLLLLPRIKIAEVTSCIFLQDCNSIPTSYMFMYQNIILNNQFTLRLILCFEIAKIIPMEFC